MNGDGSIELLAPAGSFDTALAAFDAGADAVYLGLGSFSARADAVNFTPEQLRDVIAVARDRGRRVYVTFNTLIDQCQLADATRSLALLEDLAPDGIIVQDLGVARIARRDFPGLALHASTQLVAHNLEGALALRELGFTRIVLARELPIDDIRSIAERCGVEIEVFVHGALCMCHSGQCYMSALIGRRRGNRGMCAQPCRMEYSLGGRMDDHSLSLKDNCLVRELQLLDQAGVKCVKIEGRMKRPEYVAMTTGIYSRAIRDGKAPTEDEMEQLEEIFSRQGFTQGYFKGELGRDMFGVRAEGERAASKLLSEARKGYTGTERRRVPVRFYAIVNENKPVQIGVEDSDGNHAAAEGEIPQRAEKQELTLASLRDQLYKTGGTPYACAEVHADIHSGLFLSAASINELRRKLLSDLSAARAAPPQRRALPIPEPPADSASTYAPLLAFQVNSAQQLTKELAALRPGCLYVPLTMIPEHADALAPFLDAGCTVAAVLPRVVTVDEEPQVADLLEKCRATGASEALVGNLGHVHLARRAGLAMRGDFGLNVFNSYSLELLRRAGFLSATASFELRLSQIRDLLKPLPVELIAYGRLPLMITENCVIKNSYGRCACSNQQNMLTDRRGAQFPVLKEFGCRNQIFNADKLFLGDKPEVFSDSGISRARLLFTTESPRECAEIARSYLGMNDYVPNGMTRGLYYRGVE